MDRFSWSDGILTSEEQLVVQQNGVRIYDGINKTAFDYGKLILTTHRFIWKDGKDSKCQLTMPLAYLIRIDEEAATFSKSSKIVIHLTASDPQKTSGPVVSSTFSYVRFSFQDGGQKEFYRSLAETMLKKKWEVTSTLQISSSTTRGTEKQFRSGIAGIERNIQHKNNETDKNINVAFEDMSALMEKARDMVTLSKNISQKIKDKQGDITEDETLQFKSYLLSLGIADPVTRETHGHGNKYVRELAKQISDTMEPQLRSAGGTPMTLTDVYCRVNRARGMELLSPEDLVNACRAMDGLQLPVLLREFDSGVMVLQLRSHSEAAVAVETTRAVVKNGSMTADELARIVGLSVVLSRERLLAAERDGKLCRDESTEGLRFYPNTFLTAAS